MYFCFIPFRHINSCFCLKKSFDFLNSTQVSPNLEKAWHCPVPVSSRITCLAAISFLLPSLFLILLPNELRSCPDKTGLFIFTSYYLQLFHLKSLSIKKSLCILVLLKGLEVHHTKSSEIPVRRPGLKSCGHNNFSM